jgi:hypothetical protein
LSDLRDNIQRNVTDEMKSAFLSDVWNEYHDARKRFGPDASYHEGFGVMREEVNEVDKLVQERFYDHSHIRSELVQVASTAMAMACECDPAAMPWNNELNS